MSEMVSPAEQVTRVATLLGRAVLRWKREKEQSSEISEIVSDSLPERLEFSPVSSLSVTGQNDEATGLEETSSDSEINPNNHVRGATNKDRDLDRLGAPSTSQCGTQRALAAASLRDRRDARSWCLVQSPKKHRRGSGRENLRNPEQQALSLLR